MSKFHNRYEATIANGSVSDPFVIAYTPGNLEIDDGVRTTLWLEQLQDGDTDITAALITGTLSANGINLTINAVHESTELDNTMPTFVDSDVNNPVVSVRSAVSAAVHNSSIGRGVDIFKLFIGQSGMVGVGQSTFYYPHLSEHEFFYSQFPVQQPDRYYPGEGAISKVTGVATQGDGAVRYEMPSLFHRQLDDPGNSKYKRAAYFQNAGIPGGECIEFCNNGDNLGARVVALPYAQGDTSITEWKKGTPNYNAALEGCRLALKDRKGILDGVSWHQGENDAAATMGESVYKAHLEDIVDDFRADLTALASANNFIQTSFSNLTFVFGELSETWTAYAAQKQDIHDAFQGLLTSRDYTGYAPSTGLPSDFAVSGDATNLHIHGDYLAEFGRRYYYAQQNASVNGFLFVTPTRPFDFTITPLGMATFKPSIGNAAPTMNIEFSDDNFATIITSGSIAKNSTMYQVDMVGLGLSNNTVYKARIFGTNQSGESTRSNEYEFTAIVQDYPDPVFRFAYPTAANIDGRVIASGNNITTWDTEYPANNDWQGERTVGSNASHVQWNASNDNAMVSFRNIATTADYGLTLGITSGKASNEMYTVASGLSALFRVHLTDLGAPAQCLMHVHGDAYWNFGIVGNDLVMRKGAGFTPSSTLDLTGMDGLDILLGFTYEVGSLKLYAALDNGAALPNPVEDNSWTLPESNSGAKVRLGSLVTTALATSWSLRGGMADAVVWNQALTKAELDNQIAAFTAIP